MKVNISKEECLEIINDYFGSITLTLNSEGEFVITPIIESDISPVIKVISSIVDVVEDNKTSDISTESEEVIVINNEAIQSEENIKLIQKMEALANFKYVDLNPKKINKTK